jgi:N-acetylglucosamine kinase-like BadF-type ATPase
VLGRGASGPGNPRAVGFNAALANIDASIDLAFADANLTRGPVVAACLALAGAGRKDEQERVAVWAAERAIAKKVLVSGDAEPVLAAASPDSVGIALIAGTGSLAWGRNAAGVTARCGGWGYLLGDEGSGYAIALAGLRAAVRAADGRGPETDLLSRYLCELDLDRPEDIVGAVYAPEMTRQRLAALASVVFELAPSDAAAELIVASAANELSDLVTTLVRRLWTFSDRYTMALSGGVLLNEPTYRERVVVAVKANLLTAKLPAPAACVTIDEPVGGSVELARRAVQQANCGKSNQPGI